jgi:hypothetical protein
MKDQDIFEHHVVVDDIGNGYRLDIRVVLPWSIVFAQCLFVIAQGITVQTKPSHHRAIFVVSLLTLTTVENYSMYK